MFKNKCLKIFILFSLFFSNIALPWPKISSFVPKIFAKNKVAKPTFRSSLRSKISTLFSSKKADKKQKQRFFKKLGLGYCFTTCAGIVTGIVIGHLLFLWFSRKWRPLYKAFKGSDVEKIKKLFNKVDDINAEYSTGYAPIHYPCMYGNVEILRWLVEEKGADINKKTEHSEDYLFDTPLRMACTLGHVDCIKYLLEECTNKLDNIDLIELINIACVTDRLESFKCIAYKVGYEKAMERACKYLGLRMIAYLVEEKNMMPKLTLILGLPKSKGHEKKQLKIIRYLLGKEIITINQKVIGDEKLIHRAVRIGNLDLVKFLIENGADIEARGVETNNIVMYSHQDIVNLLRDNIQALRKPINYNKIQTPLRIACEEGKLEIIKYLLKMGAIYPLKQNWEDCVKRAYDKGNVAYNFLKELEKRADDLWSIKDAEKQKKAFLETKRVYCIFLLNAKKNKNPLSEGQMKRALSYIRFDKRFLTEDEFKDAVAFAQKHNVRDIMGNTIEVAKFIYLSPQEKRGSIDDQINNIWKPGDSGASLFDEWRILRKKRKKGFVSKFLKRKKKEKINFEKYNLFKKFGHMEHISQIEPYVIRNKLRKTEVPHAGQGEASTLPDDIVENIMSFVG
ncbi:ankyrin repeat domain-containing protein [Candidatus Dependentiae bacterium]